MICRKMGDGGYSNIYEVYGDDGNLFALKVGLMLMFNEKGSDQPNRKYNTIAVSGPTEHCSIFHFPPPFVLRHRRDIITFLDILTVYTMKTIYFLNAYHLG